MVQANRDRAEMEIELARCECCGLKEDCTQDYISEVKARFDGKWLCGLCSEAVTDEVGRGKRPDDMEEALKSHMSFRGKFKQNPAVQVADGMKQMLRKCSSNLSASSSRTFARSSSSRLGNKSSLSLY